MHLVKIIIIILSINKGFIIPEFLLIKYGLEHEIKLNEFESLKSIL